MKSLAEKIGIIEKFEIELKISKKEFLKKIKDRIESKGHYFFGISNTNKPFFKGSISNDSFELKRKRRFLDSHLDFIKTSGNFYQKGSNLIINAKVSGYNIIVLIVFTIAIIIYLIGFLSITTGDTRIFNKLMFDYLFLFGHFCLMTGIPYLVIRRIVRKVKVEFDSDLHLLIHK